MARPTMPDAQRRGHVLRVYFNAAELAFVRAKAVRAKFPLARYLRRCALGQSIPAPIPGRNLLARFQLWRVKSNASQIAAVLPDAEAMLTRLRERTETVREQLIRRPWPRFAPWPYSGEPKTLAFKVRVTRSERRHIQARAVAAGRQLSGYIRDQALLRQSPPQPVELPPALFDELYETQRQWNAMAYAANSGRLDQVDLSIVDRLHRLYDAVLGALS